MTEKSYYWDGLITGDATLAPYTELAYHSMWRKMFSKYNSGGVIDSYLNELEVIGISQGVQVKSGAALVDGWFYENDDIFSVSLDLPTTNPRIDCIVLRMNYVTQTVRITVVDGTEAATPNAPAVTQIHGVTWDLKLAEVTITTAGAITVVNRRKFAITPFSPAYAMNKIEEISVSGGLAETFEFSDIPTIYRDLLLVGQWSGTAAQFTTVSVYLNDDDTATNYWRQVFNADGVAGITAAVTNAPFALTVASANWAVGDAPAFEIKIPHYGSPDFFKYVLNSESVRETTVGAAMNINSQAMVWLNTDPVDKITLYGATNYILDGTTVTLYGLGLSRIGTQI